MATISNVTTAIMEEDWVDLCDEGSLLDQDAVRFPLILIYLFVFTLCLLVSGNFFTIVVIILHPTMRTGTNYFLANLALADLLVAAFCILQNMVHVVGFDHGNWPLGEAMCYMYVFMLHFIPCLSVGILVCVSIEKYLVFMHPFSKWTQQILRRRIRFTMTMATWTLSIASNIPYALNTRLYRFSETAAACGRTDTILRLVVYFATGSVGVDVHEYRHDAVEKWKLCDYRDAT
ncbi:7 transmembrane receptor [Oesophagostomum dentatum]|uniref:7 transmembrane receptor n=1 Tax=Oesophagostomum dentatum TaxID=61180 RepID=A0A0B1T516_OESDE|nr:7 transmembrane receptor [Oesophagostomum dentatum]